MAEIEGLFLRSLPKVNFDKTMYITNINMCTRTLILHKKTYTLLQSTMETKQKVIMKCYCTHKNETDGDYKMVLHSQRLELLINI